MESTPSDLIHVFWRTTHLWPSSPKAKSPRMRSRRRYRGGMGGTTPLDDSTDISTPLVRHRIGIHPEWGWSKKNKRKAAYLTTTNKEKTNENLFSPLTRQGERERRPGEGASVNGGGLRDGSGGARYAVERKHSCHARLPPVANSKIAHCSGDSF